MEVLRSIIGKIATGATLTREESASAFDGMMSGDATPSQIGALLLGMRVRGETVEEVTGAASAMRNRMPRVETPCDPVGLSGTSETLMHSVNVSTCASFIVAGAGSPVAKHASRAASSGSSAADVLAYLGVKVDLKPEAIARCVQEADIGFAFSSAHYPAMQRIGQIRSAIGTHTIFNLIEALCNPAGLKRQIVGVFSAEWVQPLAYVLKNLGAESVWVVHGSDGLEEMTLTGPTFVAALEAGIVRTFEVSPEEAGLSRCRSDALESRDAEPHAAALQNVLDGVPGRLRDAALLNAAAALVVAGRASTLQEGVALGQESLDRGAAASRLKRLIAVSNA
ncbi:anthranilate phosphoribosyltransferase [Bradyrhizobium sp. CCBAU 11434]|uniref:anthranilate phosphoribosyltransferase n=1 Tax=Bradyrhizobium sp. CCBAU 11434 TaxID=1630885 RepID=UPI002305801B|nr:anthranilate phosphoribosyltransferase [Bradyrhizobium sp. CCBAU 11434]MDA9523338.1 anthranilate phosphoribosyltransferase [Bradyrhizobium sp. CCBAU 11434]